MWTPLTIKLILIRQTAKRPADSAAAAAGEMPRNYKIVLRRARVECVCVTVCRTRSGRVHVCNTKTNGTVAAYCEVIKNSKIGFLLRGDTSLVWLPFPPLLAAEGVAHFAPAFDSAEARLFPHPAEREATALFEKVTWLPQ